MDPKLLIIRSDGSGSEFLSERQLANYFNTKQKELNHTEPNYESGVLTTSKKFEMEKLLGMEASNSPSFKRIATNSDLERELTLAQQEGKVVMLDFYADWCKSCIEMEKFTFNHNKIAPVLQNLLLFNLFSKKSSLILIFTN